ncbi:MAG: UbiX family flavin prenyltransferase [Chloroflexi bacterium]|nr:UbiX family flavin prenyltransferase [Chloroflexota bacterium]
MGIYVLGVAGASGAPYTVRVLRGLIEAGHGVHAVISDAGRRVMDLELDVKLYGEPIHDREELLHAAGVSGPGELTVYAIDDYAAAIASGSFHTDGMAVVPCSVGTLGRIAAGLGSNLLERAADVTLKERRRLLLVPREMPLSLIHLRNMVSLTEAGAEILPPAPGFYQRPETVQDIVDSVAARVLDRLGVEASFLKRWAGPEED